MISTRFKRPRLIATVALLLVPWSSPLRGRPDGGAGASEDWSPRPTSTDVPAVPRWAGPIRDARVWPLMGAPRWGGRGLRRLVPTDAAVCSFCHLPHSFSRFPRHMWFVQLSSLRMFIDVPQRKGEIQRAETERQINAKMCLQMCMRYVRNHVHMLYPSALQNQFLYCRVRFFTTVTSNDFEWL